MDCVLPSEFDIIIIGTGVVESIISAAASRIGKRVLHIDNNNYYGGYWASFNLIDFMNLIENQVKNVKELAEDVEKSESVFALGNSLFHLKDFEYHWHIPEEDVSEQDVNIDKGNNEKDDTGPAMKFENDGCNKPVTWKQQDLIKLSRKFNIDLTPKLQYARGDFVELLISSNIARYSEYRSVSRVLTWLNGQLEVVPCSRSDVFSNNRVSVVEKRMLMKLFTSLDNVEEEIEGNEPKSYKTFLKEKRLTANLVHYVLYAISMSTDQTSTKQGIENTKRFINSLGKFGKTPFLFSMYGSGEITQAFCRLSAVFGGIYALNQPLNGLVFDKEKNFESLICRNQKITGEHLIIGAEKCPPEFVKQSPKEYISRAVLITDKSIMDSEKEHLTLLLYPPENGKNSCVIIELGNLTGTCPNDLYLVHLISNQTTSPKEDFNSCIKNLFEATENDTSKPKILWSCYFSIPNTNNLDFKSTVPNKVHVCPGPDLDLDYDFSVKKAKEIFLQIYPEAEFLPRAPDPEEIIIEGDNTVNEPSSETCNSSQECIDKSDNVDDEANSIANITANETEANNKD